MQGFVRTCYVQHMTRRYFSSMDREIIKQKLKNQQQKFVPEAHEEAIKTKKKMRNELGFKLNKKKCETKYRWVTEKIQNCGNNYKQAMILLQEASKIGNIVLFSLFLLFRLLS